MNKNEYIIKEKIIFEQEWRGVIETFRLLKIKGFLDSIIEIDNNEKWDNDRVYIPGDKL